MILLPRQWQYLHRLSERVMSPLPSQQKTFHSTPVTYAIHYIGAFTWMIKNLEKSASKSMGYFDNKNLC